MKVCRLHRPWLKGMFGGFPQRKHHIFKRLTRHGCQVEEFEIRPVPTPSIHLSYLLGMLRSLIEFRKIKTDVVIAEDVESGLFAILLGFLYRLPFVFDFIDDYAAIIRHDRQPLRYLLARWVEVMAPIRANTVVAVDRKKMEFCNKIGVPSQKVRLIPNGYDSGLFIPAAKDGGTISALGASDAKVLIYVGKLNRYYNIEVLIRAMALVAVKLPTIQLLVVGEGDNSAELHKLTDQLGVRPQVRFLGPRPHHEIPKLINIADLCLFPLADESALALYEYMGCAKAVIVPATGTEKMGITRTAFPDNCLLRVANTPEGFADGIQHLLNDEARARQMGVNAHRRISQGYDWDTIGTEYLNAVRAAVKSDAVGKPHD